MPKDIVVLGPPGTGKTSSGVITTKDWFRSNHSTSEVAYLAFTKAAAREAAGRVMDEDFKKDFGDQLPYFRTLHSLAYMGLKRAKPDVRLVTTADMKGFAKWSSFEGKYAIAEWEDMAEVYRKMQERGQAKNTDWDDCLNAYTLSRISAKDADGLKAAKVMMSNIACNSMGRLDSERYQSFVAKYETYKETNGLVDFTDMLEYALTEMEPIDDVRKVIVDECLPAGTLITMANGSKKPIEQIQVGEEVVGVDHKCGILKRSRVVERRKRLTQGLLTINGNLTLTGNHPVFVIGRGYVRADGISVGERIVRLSRGRDSLQDLFHKENGKQGCGEKRANNMFEDMRRKAPFNNGVSYDKVFGLRERLQEGKVFKEEVLLNGMFYTEVHNYRTKASGAIHLQSLRSRQDGPFEARRESSVVLRPDMRGGLHEEKHNWGCNETGRPEKEKTLHEKMQGLRGSFRTNRKAEREEGEVLRNEMPWTISEIYEERAAEPVQENAYKQSHERSCYKGENEAIASGDRPSPIYSRGKRTWVNEASSSSLGEAGCEMAAGTSDCHKSKGLESGRSGPRESGSYGFGGVRWAFPCNEQAEGDRQKERCDPSGAGVDADEVFEYGDNGEFGFCLKIDLVRSVEAVSAETCVYNIGTETENYFAENILVHNCQDISPILFSIVDRAFQNSEQIWWLGDDDQCIFRFSAADASLFINRARNATRIFLRQTHRFGNDIVNFSKDIITRVGDRVQKEVIGKDGKEHIIKMTGQFQPQAFGDMLLLHRHVAGCQALGEAYVHAGMPFRNERGRDPLGSHARVLGYKALRALADGKSVTPGSVARLVDDLMPSTVIDENKGKKIRLVVHGAKKKLQNISNNAGDMNIMDCMRAGILTEDGADVIRQKFFNVFKHSDDLEYYDRVVDNGFDLEGECPVITTIHGSKGREAGKVVVFSEMGMKCWDDEETEHRLAYVAATRTKRELEICAESTLPWGRVTHYNYPVGKEKRGNMTQVVTGAD